MKIHPLFKKAIWPSFMCPGDENAKDEWEAAGCPVVEEEGMEILPSAVGVYERILKQSHEVNNKLLSDLSAANARIRELEAATKILEQKAAGKNAERDYPPNLSWIFCPSCGAKYARASNGTFFDYEYAKGPDEIRNAALEDAAKVIDGLDPKRPIHDAIVAIRGLKK